MRLGQLQTNLQRLREKVATDLGQRYVVVNIPAAQVEAGAKIIDVNAGVPGADEAALIQEMITAIQEVTDTPLCFDTANEKALQAALEMYEGKALINSVNGEEDRLESVLPLAKEYDASVIALCMDDDGIPPTPAPATSHRAPATVVGSLTLAARTHRSQPPAEC